MHTGPLRMGSPQNDRHMRTRTGRLLRKRSGEGSSLTSWRFTTQLTQTKSALTSELIPHLQHSDTQ
jgi:hypothetical protein